MEIGEKLHQKRGEIFSQGVWNSKKGKNVSLWAIFVAKKDPYPIPSRSHPPNSAASPSFSNFFFPFFKFGRLNYFKIFQQIFLFLFLIF